VKLTTLSRACAILSASLVLAACSSSHEGVSTQVAPGTAANPILSPDEAEQALGNTVKLSTVKADDFDAVFYPGGHGPLWDLAEDAHSVKLIESFWAAGKPVASVCHAPGVLRDVKDQNGLPLVKDKRVTGFSNSEEDAVGLTDIVPFLVEDELKKNGGDYSKAADWRPYVVTDGNLITGQNPASSASVAQALLKLLGGESAK